MSIIRGLAASERAAVGVTNIPLTMKMAFAISPLSGANFP